MMRVEASPGEDNEKTPGKSKGARKQTKTPPAKKAKIEEDVVEVSDSD